MCQPASILSGVTSSKGDKSTAEQVHFSNHTPPKSDEYLYLASIDPLTLTLLHKDTDMNHHHPKFKTNRPLTLDEQAGMKSLLSGLKIIREKATQKPPVASA